VYEALTEAAKTGLNFLVVLTDLRNDVLVEAVLTQREEGRIIVAQLSASWRFSVSLDEAYAEYQRNSQTIQRLQGLGLTVFDARPEKLVETVTQEMSKRNSILSARPALADRPSAA
jgi:hypothetical protein